MKKEHHYSATVIWTGNLGAGTSHYSGYERSHDIQIPGKPDLLGSSDPVFRGDHSKHNPEDLFLSSLSSCHMLWYLHLCAEAGVIVLEYTDHATGVLEESGDGGGRFTEVTLHPKVLVTDESMVVKAIELHHQANEKCFIANSLNFRVGHVVKVDC